MMMTTGTNWNPTIVSNGWLEVMSSPVANKTPYSIPKKATYPIVSKVVTANMKVPSEFIRGRSWPKTMTDRTMKYTRNGHRQSRTIFMCAKSTGLMLNTQNRTSELQINSKRNTAA